MSAEDINNSFFSNFTEASQEEGEDIPGPPALGQVGGYTSLDPHSQNPAQTVESVVRRPTALHNAGSRRRSRWGTTPGEEKGENDIEDDFEDDPPHDPAGADVQGQAAAAALLRAQADAQQTAFENQIWAYNDSGATVMAHVQGATTGSSNGEFYDYHGPGGYTPSPCICQAVGDVATLADRATAIIRRRDEGKRARRVRRDSQGDHATGSGGRGCAEARCGSHVRQVWRHSTLCVPLRTDDIHLELRCKCTM